MITPEEFSRFEEAFKSKEFLDMFLEYAHEMADPANRKRAEEELIALEAQNGKNMVLMRPEPVKCVKVKLGGSGKKLFVNICKSDLVEEPSSTHAYGGVNWRLPHKFSPTRKSFDKDGKEYLEHDVTFHPAVFELMKTNQRFVNLIIDSALETLETTFKYKFPREEYIILKRSCKSAPVSLSVRVEKGFKVPKFQIVERINQAILSEQDVQPDEIVIRVDLKGIKSAKEINFSMSETNAYLRASECYEMNVNLPHRIIQESVKCTFNVDKQEFEAVAKTVKS